MYIINNGNKKRLKSQEKLRKRNSERCLLSNCQNVAVKYIKNAKQQEIAVDNRKLLKTLVIKDYYNNYRNTAKVIRRTIIENTIVFTV